MTNPKNKERLDLLLLERGLVSSRTKAQALILAGQVRVEGEAVTKVGALVALGKNIELVSGPKYVSRGGEKLAGALEDFKVSPQGLTCLDVGASTGGFTDCLLQNGAKVVYAVDVGHGQLDVSLRQNPQVVCMEETHILHATPSMFQEKPQLAVIDASFISLKKILGHVKTLLADRSQVLALVKPQFEVGPKLLKKGVVKSEAAQLDAVDSIVEFAKQEGFFCLAQSPARLKGPKGNQEYFIHLKTHGDL